jgi:hypothetical protein
MVLRVAVSVMVYEEFKCGGTINNSQLADLRFFIKKCRQQYKKDETLVPKEFQIL